MAVTAKWFSYPDRLHWIVENGFALEYAEDPEALDVLGSRMAPYLQRDIPIRYHGFLPGYEIGHQDPQVAERGMDVHMTALDSIDGQGEQVITFHIGLDPEEPIDGDRAVENLTRLVKHGQDLGITVCLENLRQGPTSDPATVVEWAMTSGAMITLDIGHAVSCQLVRSGKISALEYLESFADRLYEVHVYGYEADRHYPPRDMRALGPIVDRLLETACRWWTIELDDYAEILATRQLLLDYLKGGQTIDSVAASPS
jgi:sugar phosphate isomerase/epimerase